MKTTCILLLLTVQSLCWSQESVPIVVDSAHYEVDHNLGIIVLHDATLKNDFASPITQISLDGNYQLEQEITSLTNKKVYILSKEGKRYKLFLTQNPIIAITVKDSLEKFPKKPATFRYHGSDTTFSSPIGMGLRGNLSLTYPKKSFNIEFYQDAKTQQKREIDFVGLRKEDDFILDGIYNEPLLLRANFSQRLWKEIHPPFYASEEPKARSTVDGFYVDLFVNNSYRGVYFLSEKVNRSLLKLKKKKKDTVRGELFKATSYEPGTSFNGVPEFKNSLPTWAGFEMKYPYEDYTSHWGHLSRTMNFIVNSSASDFASEMDSHIEIENVMDYFLFINLIRATDNMGKNYYVARYKEGSPYFIVPWDMDGVLGTIQDGKRIPTTDDILSNYLFDRLWNENPNNYKSKLKERWGNLRMSAFSKENLISKIEDIHQTLKEQHYYKRDELVWKKSHQDEHLEYMLEWLKKRLTYLDAYFQINESKR